MFVCRVRPFLPFQYDFRPVTLLPLEFARLFVLITLLLWTFNNISVIIPNNSLIAHDIACLLAVRIKTSAHTTLKIFYQIYFTYSFIFFTFTKVMIILWYYGVDVSIETIAYSLPIVIGFLSACVITIVGPFIFICLQVFSRSTAAKMDTCAAVMVFLSCVAGFMTAPAYMNYYPSVLVEYSPLSIIMLMAAARLLYNAYADGKKHSLIDCLYTFILITIYSQFSATLHRNTWLELIPRLQVAYSKERMHDIVLMDINSNKI